MSKYPKAIGPYSIKREHNGLLFISGQLPIDPDSNELIEDFEDACRMSLNNIKNIIAEENLLLNSVIKLTILTTHLHDFDTINKVFEEFFEEEYPARSTYEVSKLPKNASIEIEAIAVRSK